LDPFETSCKKDKLLSYSECYHSDESVEIHRTRDGKYRVVHRLVGENHLSGDLEHQEHEKIVDSSTQAFDFLLETMGTVFGEPSWYIIEALETARVRDESFDC
jgi:hypothetical protein